MDYITPEEPLLFDRNVDMFSSEKQNPACLFNQDDDFIQTLFPDFDKGNSPIKTTQIHDINKETPPNGIALNSSGTLKNEGVINNGQPHELTQKMSNNGEELEKANEHLNGKEVLKCHATYHETGLPEMQTEPGNDNSDLEILRMKYKKITEENLELKTKCSHIMESDDLQMKCDMTEKENIDLKDKIAELEAQNYQYRQLVKQKEEKVQKIKERLRELYSKIEAYEKMKSTFEASSTLLIEKESNYKKIMRKNKKLHRVVNQFAEKLSNSNLLTGKEKRILKSLSESSSNSEEVCNSEDQEEETGCSSSSKSYKVNSNMSQNVNTTPEHSYCAPDPRKSLVYKNSKNNESDNKTSSFQKPKNSSATNCLMKGCQDASDVPDYVNLVSQLEPAFQECKLALSRVENSHILVPLPPSPPPKHITSKHNLSSKDLTRTKTDNLTLSSNQNSQKTINQELQETKLSSTTPKENQFRHQQSEGFEVSDDQPHNTSNLNSKDSGVFVVNNAASCSRNYINICAERVGNEGMNLTFDVARLTDLKIDLENWCVSCYLGSKQKSTTCKEKSTISLPSQVDLIDEQKDDANSQPNDESPSRKKHKILIESPSSRIAIPKMNEFSSNDFASIKRSNQSCTVNQNVSMINNNSDKHAFRNESYSSSSQISENNSHILELDVKSQNQSFANSLKNYKSSSSKSPSPLKKKIKISTSPFVKEQFFLGNEETSSYISENTKTKNSLHINQTETQLKYNSDQKASGSHYVSNVIGEVYDSTSEPEITSSPESQKFNSKKCIVKKRKKKDLSPSNEKLNVISVHNKRKIFRNKAIASTNIYVCELDTKNNIVSANDEPISDAGGRETEYLKRSKPSSKRPSKSLKCHDSKVQTSSNLADGTDLQLDSVAETIINKHNSVQILNGRKAPNMVSIGSRNIDCNITNKTPEIESVVANNADLKYLDEEVLHEIKKNKEFDKPFKKSKTLKKKFQNKRISEVNSKNLKIVHSSKSKKDKNKSLKEIKRKLSKDKMMKKHSLKMQVSEFVTMGVNIETEENKIVSSGNPLPASFSVSTSITDNLLEHSYEEVCVSDSQNKGILDPLPNKESPDSPLPNKESPDSPLPNKESPDSPLPNKESPDSPLPNKEIENSSNCFPQDSVNITAKISIKTEGETFLKDSRFNTFVKNELDLNKKKSERTSAACKELHVNDQGLDSNELDSPKFNLPCDKIAKQEIEVNFTNEDSFAKTNEMTSQNMVFLNKSNSFPNKSNNLKGNQFSVQETNEFTCPKINDSSIKIKSSPHSSPLKNSLFESNNTNISVMDVHPFYTDASMKARNVQVNEEYSFDENTLYSQKSNKIVNFSVVDNDKLVSSETEINDDQNMESIKTDSFALFRPDVVSTNILLSPVEEKDQYVNSKKEEPSLSKRQHEDSSVEIGVEQSLSSSSQSDLEKKEVNAIENSQLILNVGQNIENWLGNVAVSNLGVETEVEERTQGTFSRPSGKKQDFSLSETEIEKEKKILKKSFKNSCISVAEQSESMNGDPKHFTDPISEIDSDYEPTMVIAEDDEVSHSSYDSNVEDSVRTAGNPACNDSLNETSSEEEYENQEESSEEIKYTKISIPEIIKQVFDKVEKTIAPACFKDCVKNLVKALIDPNNAKNCQELIYYLISHLCVSRKNPMQSFNLRNNPEVLLPLTEKSFVTALFFIAFENKPHLTGLLTSTVNTLYHIILLKTQYHINGLSSLCRVLTVMCKLLKDIRKIKILCYDIFKHNHKYAPYLLGSIISIWPEALAMSSDSTEEERLFIRAIAYGCEQKPRTLTDTHWKNCNCVLRVYFNIEVLHYNANDVAIHIMNKIISKCLSEPIEDDFLLKGPLIIYSRIKGRDWTLKFLLEKLILPSLTSFCEEANENGFKFLTDLIADLCFVFEESVSQKLLLEYATSSKEVEFIYCYGGMSLLKLVCLKKELFPDVLKQWSIDYTNDPRTDICVRYFYWRMILDSDLYLEEMCLNNI